MADNTVPEFDVSPVDEITRLQRRHASARHLADGHWNLVFMELCNSDRENRVVLDTLLFNATRATLTQSAISVELGRALVEGGGF